MLNSAQNSHVSEGSRPKYAPPSITVMSDEDVLRAFQMTAAQIGAAATWWTPSC